MAAIVDPRRSAVAKAGPAVAALQRRLPPRQSLPLNGRRVCPTWDEFGNRELVIRAALNRLVSVVSIMWTARGFWAGWRETSDGGAEIFLEMPLGPDSID